MNKKYFVSVSLMTFVIPVIGLLVEHLTAAIPLSFEFFGKWFIFQQSDFGYLLQASNNPQTLHSQQRKFFTSRTRKVFPL